LAKNKPSKEAGGKAFGLRLKAGEAAGVILPTAAGHQPPTLSIPVVTQLETQIALLEEQNALLPAQCGMSREQLAVGSGRLGVRSDQGAVGSGQPGVSRDQNSAANSTRLPDHCSRTTAP